MNSKTVLLTVITIILIGGVGTFVYFSNNNAAPSESAKSDLHFHAGFTLYQNGIKVDLADWKYMHEEPCSLDGHEEEESTPENEQIEKAHMHDLIGDVVHVHREHATWGDLFENIGITFNGPVSGYTETGIESDVLDRKINAYDRVLIVEGELDDPITKLGDVPSVDRIKEVESMSETCGS